MSKMLTPSDIFKDAIQEFATVHARIFRAGKKTLIAADGDPGNDDFMNFAYAAGKELLEFIMISASAGNVGPQLTLNNSLFMVEKAGLKIPVYPGAARPFGVSQEAMHNASAAHGKSGLSDGLSPEEIAREITHKAEPMLAAQRFAELMHHEDKPFTLMMTGALTTLAQAIFILQRQLEHDANDQTEETQARNRLIDEIIGDNAKDRSEAAQEFLSGKKSLSDLVTKSTRQFLQKRINEGKLESLVMMGGVFPETQESIAQAKLPYTIKNIGPNGQYHRTPDDYLKPDYTPEFASPSNGTEPEYGWHGNQPIFDQDGKTPLPPHKKVREFNFAHDPLATQMVFTLFREIEAERSRFDLPFPKMMVPLNTTHKILAGDYNIGERLIEGDLKMKQEFGLDPDTKTFAFWASKVMEGTGFPYILRTGYHISKDGKHHPRKMIHDLITAALIANPKLFVGAAADVYIDNPEDGDFLPNQGRTSLKANPKGNVMIIDIPPERREELINDIVASILAASRKGIEIMLEMKKASAPKEPIEDEEHHSVAVKFM